MIDFANTHAFYPKNANNLIYSYVVASATQVISWDASDITIVDAPPHHCLPIVYEMWDTTDGTEQPLSNQGIVTVDFSTSTHTMSIYTNDLNKIAIYNLRFKVYLTGDPNNLLEKNFRIDVN